MSEPLRDRLDDLGDRVEEALSDIKPKLRGWLHLATAPLSVAAGIVLIALSPTAATKVGSAIYALSAALLFTVSAIYHRGTWSPRVAGWLKRVDHANIFLLIAGSYTPLTLVLLDGVERTVMLAIVWLGAAVGGASRILWPEAPRWLYTSIYLLLGWAALLYVDDYIQGAEALGFGAGTAVLVLLVAGGVLYTLGGVVYGLKRPDPWPRWFGFHEIFHAFTIAAFICHYIGVSLATYTVA